MIKNRTIVFSFNNQINAIITTDNHVNQFSALFPIFCYRLDWRKKHE